MHYRNQAISSLVLSIALFLQLCSGEEHNVFQVGVGLGIGSYPGALDPEEHLTQYSTLFPALRIDIEMMPDLSLCGAVSAQIHDAFLMPADYTQQLKINTTGLGLDYNLGTEERSFKIGLQYLQVFTEYISAGQFASLGSGPGIRLYCFGSQPLLADYSLGVCFALQYVPALAITQGHSVDLKWAGIAFLLVTSF